MAVRDRAPIGLLTLQGDYEKHRQAFAALGRETRGVRRPGELEGLGAHFDQDVEAEQIEQRADHGHDVFRLRIRDRGPR